MNSLIRTIITVVACGCFAWQAHGQGTAIKVTTVLHDDESRTVTKIDAEQHTSEALTYSAANKLLQKIVFQLDENNVPQSGIVYAPNGVAVRKIVYKYDSTNRVSEESNYTTDGRLLGRYVYEYNSNGRAKIRAFDANGNELGSNPAAWKDKKPQTRKQR